MTKVGYRCGELGARIEVRRTARSRKPVRCRDERLTGRAVAHCGGEGTPSLMGIFESNGCLLQTLLPISRSDVLPARS